MTDASASKMRPALIGGLVLGVASGLPFVNALNCACCLWVVIGGVIASYLYVKDSTLKVEYGDAAVLGLFTGLFGAIISTIVSLPLTLMFNIGGSAQMDQTLEQLRSNPDVPPELVRFFETLVNSGVLSAGFSVVGLLISIVIFALFAMLGAIIGVAIFQKDKGTAPPPPAKTDSGTPPPPSGLGGTGTGSGPGGSSAPPSGGPSSSGGAPPSSGPSSGGPPPSSGGGSAAAPPSGPAQAAERPSSPAPPSDAPAADQPATPDEETDEPSGDKPGS